MRPAHHARRLHLVFGVLIAVLIVLSAVSYRSAVASTTGALWIGHAHQVIERLEGLLSNTQDIENGYRGFVITGDAAFLAPYEAGLAKVRADLAMITTLTEDNPDQQRRLARLTTLVGQKVRFGDQVVRLRRHDGPQAASERVAGGDGIRLRDDIRRLIDDMRSDEERLIVARQVTADRDFNRVTFVLALGIVGAILVLGLVGWMVSRDTSARWERAQALRQSEERLRRAKDAAETANRARGMFLANMRHRILTPMNGVIGMTDLVLDTELSSDQRENLLIVKSSADALLAIISDILEFSRMGVGDCELDRIAFNPREAIRESASTVALMAHRKGLELTVDVGAAVPDTVRGDPGRLRWTLVNLLRNAIRCTPLGEVALRVTSEAATPEGVVLRFSVGDIGIPLDRQEIMFEPFTEADASTMRTDGAGPGLTVSSYLVRQMGRHLSVETEASKGSAFHFPPRFASVNAPAANASVCDAVDLRDLPVLIVDNSATNRRLLEQMLIGWRMVPTLAASVPEALAALRAALESGRPFPLVLTDVRMPDMDAFTLAEAIKQDPAIAGAAIVMLTSAGQPGDAARCRELGIAACVPKPIRRSDLRGAILHCTKHRRDARSEAHYGSTDFEHRQALETVSRTGLFDHARRHGGAERSGPVPSRGGHHPLNRFREPFAGRDRLRPESTRRSPTCPFNSMKNTAGRFSSLTSVAS